MAKSLLIIKLRLRHINVLLTEQKKVGTNVLALEYAKKLLVQKQKEILETLQVKNALLDHFIELG